MTRAHEIPFPGPAAEFAATLAAQLPVLQTERLTLRPSALPDFPDWADILCGPDGQWLGGPFTRDQAFTEFAAAVGTWLLRGHGPWTVETKSGEVLGFVLIGFEPGDIAPELGYFFHRSAHGRGYAVEAAKAVHAHAFEHLALPELVSMIDPENARSQNLALRLGAAPDGTVDGAQIWRHKRRQP